ncbi:HNH endonuclease family protein [Streptomyces sp. NRRL S-920]|uniref:HNH endonuclease family protein n=1 Tax=Streptomyces sp. NRRL S-920 TaxID=1463921 RepID=UPI0004C54AF0|nr:HNH endonuclease family protein [Streptomyces sp. NRRL S-920]
MITPSMRAALAAALLALPLTSASPSAADADPVALPMTLKQAVAALPTAAESREGYERSRFPYWTDDDRDGCDTREEVLVTESRTAPTIGEGCKVTAGRWFSYYDGRTITQPRGLAIDFTVPLAEAWDSGASAWNAVRRTAYANDLGDERSLVAVTARSNRAKSDQDPAEWQPPLADARCTYTNHWVATKLRWGLSVDKAERQALRELAAGCGQETVEYEPVG